MTQKELNLVYNITVVLATDPWFKNKSRDEVQEWVRDSLAKAGIYSISLGSSWGVLCDEQTYNDYQNDNKQCNER